MLHEKSSKNGIYSLYKDLSSHFQIPFEEEDRNWNINMTSDI